MLEYIKISMILKSFLSFIYNVPTLYYYDIEIFDTTKAGILLSL